MQGILKSEMRISTAKLKFLFLIFSFGIIFSIIYGSFSILVYEMTGCLLIVLFFSHTDNIAIRNLIIIKIVSIFFILMVYYGNISQYGAPYYHGGSDDVSYENDIELFVEENAVWPWDFSKDRNAKGFLWISAMIFRISSFVDDYHTMAFRMFNIDLLLIVGILVYKLCRIDLKMSVRHASAAMLSVTLLPNSLYLSSFVFRDTMCVMMIVLCFALSRDLYRGIDEEAVISKNKIFVFIFNILIFFVSYWIRTELLFLDILILLICVLRNNTVNNKNIVRWFLIGLIMFYFFYQTGAVSYLYRKILRYISYMDNRIELNNSNILYRKIFQTPLFPYGIILRMVYGLISPLPNGIARILSIKNALNLCDVFVSMGTCIQIVFLPFLFKGIKMLDKYMLGFLLIFISVVISTFTFRHFIMIYPFMYISIINSYRKCSSGERVRAIGTGVALLGIAGISYFIFKAAI